MYKLLSVGKVGLQKSENFAPDTNFVQFFQKNGMVDFVEGFAEVKVSCFNVFDFSVKRFVNKMKPSLIDTILILNDFNKVLRFFYNGYDKYRF